MSWLIEMKDDLETYFRISPQLPYISDHFWMALNLARIQFSSFFVISFQPAPFFVLDEIDAALDNTNIGKVNPEHLTHATYEIRNPF